MPYDHARQKSRQALHRAMLELMRQKPVRSITVTELCTICRLNRSTFYAHYATIDHLLRDLHEDLFLRMEEYLHLTPYVESAKDKALFTSFLIHICQEDERFRLFIRNDERSLFVSNMVNFFLTRLCPENAPPARRNSQLYHMVGAFTLLCAWIHEGYPCPAEELARQIIGLSHGIKRP